ncbi:FHA domain-containing protein [Acinetobacter tjernbergiae]|uniref:FHA domain-containing protein n=1 Tax=Acinetobacter tjernbergiae DSM 14971 = CIP 107465 TaxID=1120928 RepID=V2V4S1_9GAMM|nr:FHA domain-containing protein [Acinetobacter tjernbergiae]ESK55846.1 hypothetical protein F990_01500 [Acinetobacter tjernbergiae DSM 14971 = CIP 107465]
MTWKLQAITGEFTGQEISIAHDMLVGRHQDADILLQSADISRRHAALLLKEQQLWVQDLNSSNGTFINDMRVEQETALHDGDILQFASFMFSVLAAPIEKELPEIELEPVSSNTHDIGMPSLADRSMETPINRDGMPQQVGIPKPAPIPEGVDVQAEQQQPTAIEEPVSRVQQEIEQQKNASVGLISIVVLIILAVIAWLFFK